MRKNALVVAAALVMLFCFAPLAISSGPVEVRDSDSVPDLLKRNIGKKVEVILVSGDRLAGK